MHISVSLLACLCKLGMRHLAGRKQFVTIKCLMLHAGMHINDSKCALGSRRDRHENVGRGMIGIKMFECIMNDPRLDGAAILIPPETLIVREDVLQLCSCRSICFA